VALLAVAEVVLVVPLLPREEEEEDDDDDDDDDGGDRIGEVNRIGGSVIVVLGKLDCLVGVGWLVGLLLYCCR